jgi:hypothetical protein
MLDNFQNMMIDDFGGKNGYGRIVAGWKGQAELVRECKGPLPLGPLGAHAKDFVDGVYFLISTGRSIILYRGFETFGLQAPFGKDHPSFIMNLIASRNPGRPDGFWWSPRRPSASIDRLRLSDLNRGEDRDALAIRKSFNRLDYYLQGELPIGSLVYVGRAAKLREDALFGSENYSGGGIQFRLPWNPHTILCRFRTYRTE